MQIKNPEIHHNIAEILEAIENTSHHYGRTPSAVDLEIAIKTRSSAEAFAAGTALEYFGRPALLAHNRVQEAQVTTPALRESNLQNFHSVLIGSLQKNKINHALKVFNEIESLDSLSLAQAISQRLLPTDTLPVLIQVNTSKETSKSGFLPEVALESAQQITQLPGLKVIGFMTIGAHTDNTALIAKSFADLREIRDAAMKLPHLSEAKELSMGMSSDYQIAIAEGSTRIRIGSAIFGPRH